MAALSPAPRPGSTDRAREFQPVAGEVVAELEALVGQALTHRESTALERALKGVIAL